MKKSTEAQKSKLSSYLLEIIEKKNNLVIMKLQLCRVLNKMFQDLLCNEMNLF